MWQRIDFGVARGARESWLKSSGSRSGSVSGTAETTVYNGGSPWADYWTQTVSELRNDLINSGKVDEALVDTFLAYCADSTWWTQTIAFTAVAGRAIR
jgi:hypothetical protein